MNYFKYFLAFLLGSSILFIFYILAFVQPQERVARENFNQSCYARDGIVLKTTTGSSKIKQYEYVCVKKDMVLE